MRFRDCFFLQHSKGISHHYAALFRDGGGEENDKAQTVAKKWGWYQIIHRLADGDITKMEAVETIYIDVALTFLSYEKDLELQEKVKI